jgi:hypothetical protein
VVQLVEAWESQAVNSREDRGEKKTRSYPGGARELALWFLMF